MTSIINASISSNGIVSTADASGILLCQSNGVNTNARAWANWDGTSSSPSTIRSSYNVSSITKAGTSQYTINFTNALTNSNYAVVASAGTSGTTGPNGIIMTANQINTTSCYVGTRNGANSDATYDSVSMVVFG